MSATLRFCRTVKNCDNVMKEKRRRYYMREKKNNLDWLEKVLVRNS